MKNILIAVLLLSSYIASHADSSVSHIKAEASACANAVVRKDFDAVTKYTHPRIVEMMGGKDGLIQTVKDALIQMDAQGVSFDKVEIGEPEVPAKIGGWLVSIVPQKIKLKVEQGTLVKEAHLLGIFDEPSQSWVFVDLGPISKAQLKEVFPEIAGLDLPPKKRPYLLR